MRAALLAASIALTSTPAPAETPMSAAEFDAYVTGKTLYYSSRGTAYGAEQYLPGRRVVWTFLDGECQEGVWYEQGEMICFRYDAHIDPQCWTFWEGASGLAARFENDPDATELYEVSQSPDPLFCPGPDVGA